MQPATNKVEVQDEESFDFLETDKTRPVHTEADNAEQLSSRSSGRRRGGRVNSDNRPFPKIRKPVSVTESGALRAPKPGDPIPPPPPLTDGIRPVNPSKPEGAKRDKVNFDDLDLGLDDQNWPASEQWTGLAERPSGEISYNPRQGSARKFGYAVGVSLVAAGVAIALIGLPKVQEIIGFPISTEQSGSTESIVGVNNEVGQRDSGLAQTQPAANESTSIPSTATSATPSLNERFKVELSELESMLARGEFENVSVRLQSMDRTVYGYGAPEFTQIEKRVAEGSTAPITLVNDNALNTNANQQAEADALSEARVLQEQQDAAAAQAAALQQEQQAQLARESEQARAEAEQARAESERAEQARLQAQQNEAAAQARAAEERQAQLAEAEQIRADRLAQEQARQAQLDRAREQRLEQDQQSQQAANNRSNDWQAVQAGSEQLTVEQRAAAQREEARQQRLLDAQQRSSGVVIVPEPPVEQIEVESPAIEASGDIVVALAETTDTEISESSGPQRITDTDLQLVYAKFAQLEQAIENRDIDSVIGLTERSVLRIQQVLQMFENNVSVEARLRNVSTLDATGEIQGVLQITRLERADGSITGPSLNLSSIRLSSTKDEGGWSAIRW